MVSIVSVDDGQTTARYLERAAARASTARVVYHTRLDHLPASEADDLLLLVDPVTKPLPLGLEALSGQIAGYLIDVHQGFADRAALLPFLDVAFVAQKDYVARVKAHSHSSVHWLPLACEPSLFPPRRNERYDVGFVGQLGRKDTKRHTILAAVLPRVRTNDYARFHQPSEMAEVYASSKIVLNASVNGDLNMRVFEALGSGALLVTDRIQNGLEELFAEGKHYIAYDEPLEAYEKIAFYLKNDSARQRIAWAGHKLALAEHTYDHRWATMTDTLSKETGLSAEIRRSSPPVRARQYAELYARQRKMKPIMDLFRSPRSRGARALIAFALLQAVARKTNSLVPLTPGAIRERYRRPGKARSLCVGS